jgi:hypothetical protein
MILYHQTLVTILLSVRATYRISILQTEFHRKLSQLMRHQLRIFQVQRVQVFCLHPFLSSNVTVTGNITIELKEIFSKKDMILTGILPMSKYKPLVSGGEIYINATQNGQTLRLLPNKIIYATVPAGVNPSYQMQEFYSESNSLFDTTGWTTNNNNISVVQDSSGGSTFFNYYFQIDSMQWINCDYFWYNTSPKTAVGVSLPSQFNSTNCLVFMSVDGQNSLGRLFDFGGGFLTAEWPIGTVVTFIAIAEINGQYYSSFQGGTLVDNHVETISMNATTLTAIRTQLAGLP